MARLTKVQWLKARALHEVQGHSFHEIARRMNCNPSAVSRKASKEGWAKSNEKHQLVQDNIQAVRQLAEIEEKKSLLSPAERNTIDTEVNRELQLLNLSDLFHYDLMNRGREMTAVANSPDELAKLSTVAKNTNPRAQKAPQVAVQNNVQAQAVSAVDMAKYEAMSVDELKAELAKIEGEL